MKIAGIRKLRAPTAELLGGNATVLVTKHGRVSGIYLPLQEADRLPMDLRRELATVLGRHLSRVLQAQGVTEDQVAKDFSANRKRRR
jgi:hypothetical protein